MANTNKKNASEPNDHTFFVDLLNSQKTSNTYSMVIICIEGAAINSIKKVEGNAIKRVINKFF